MRDERSIDLAPGAKMQGIELFAYCGNRTLHSPAEETFEATEAACRAERRVLGLLCLSWPGGLCRRNIFFFGFLTAMGTVAVHNPR